MDLPYQFQRDTATKVILPPGTIQHFVLSYFDPYEAMIAHPHMRSTCIIIREIEFYEDHTMTHQKCVFGCLNPQISSVTSHLKKI